MYIERRQVLLDLTPETVFRSYTGIGGARGWLYMDWSWAMRGWMDKAVGGVGLRRGRRHPDEVRTGESLDFWRVEEVEPNRLLRLRAEMKLPGKAWLEFKSDPAGRENAFHRHGLLCAVWCPWFSLLVRHVDSPPLHLRWANPKIGSRARVLAHSY